MIEYLLSLRECSRDLYQARWDNLIKVDDVILIRSPVKERPFWQMGIVTQLIYGDDNKVRSVFVRTPGGQINIYPIKHLFPLELSLTHNGSSQPVVSNSPSVPSPTVSDIPVASSVVPTTIASRPQRKAALVARKQFLDYDESEDSE